MKQLSGTVDKGWGTEDIWCTTDKYCGKFLNFHTGCRFSMHFHKEKDETWYILSGEFLLEYIDTSDASIKDKILKPGDVWRNLPLVPHRLTALKAGSIIEVSTPDSVEDNYRVFPGDSQNSLIKTHFTK